MVNFWLHYSIDCCCIEKCALLKNIKDGSGGKLPLPLNFTYTLNSDILGDKSFTLSNVMYIIIYLIFSAIYSMILWMLLEYVCRKMVGINGITDMYEKKCNGQHCIFATICTNLVLENGKRSSSKHGLKYERKWENVRSKLICSRSM